MNGKAIVARLREDSSRVLSATLDGDSITGTVVLVGGAKVSFGAALSAEPSGLWQASQVDASGEAVNQGAWIVLPDGTQHGALKPLKPRGPAAPVGPVKPIGNLSPIGPVSARDLPGMAPGQPCREEFDNVVRLMNELITAQTDLAFNRIPYVFFESLYGQLENALNEWNGGGSGGNGASCAEVTGVSAALPVAL